MHRDLPLTRDLANRIERILGLAILEETTAPHNRSGQEAAKFGRTIAIKAAGGRPSNKVLCFGQDDLGRLAEILDFYSEDNLTPRFYLAPMGFTRQVAQQLTAAGFGQCRFEQAILYGIPHDSQAELPGLTTIEGVTDENLEEFIRTTADGFDWRDPWRGAAMEELRAQNTNGSFRYIASYDGKPAGVAVLRVDGDNVAHLADGAVTPDFRNRGLHLALVRHRLNQAHRLGCSLVIGAAAFNSTSFQNQQRAGLRLAYVESEWHKLNI